MQSKTRYEIYLATAVLAVGAVTYLFWKRKSRLLDAVDAFSYINIKIVTNERNCDEAVNELRRRCCDYNALGFDCEWVTDHGKRKPVALVQLSSSDGLCCLFRLSSMETIPNSLKDLLEDEKIYKVGVAANDDGKYLFQDYSVKLKSTLDVRYLAELCGLEPGGLAVLSKNLLRIVLDKSWRIRCSNWEADELTVKQKQYAAADAHVAIKIFEYLLKEYRFKSMMKDLLRLSKKLSVDDICQKYADIGFKQKSRKVAGDIPKESKLKDVRVSKRYVLRSKPLYQNCFLQAPDGDLLCTCDNKKALWYVDKGLAEVVGGEPLTVRLRFEPAGRSVGEVGRYYAQPKANRCVVCGATNSYIRKNVVPREYRKYFPEIMKEHSSHDVVLLCAACHQRSNARDQAVRARLAERARAPLPAADNARETLDVRKKKVKSAANALLYQSQKHELPEERRKVLEQIILDYYPQHKEVSEDVLKEAVELCVVQENVDYESHGMKVVEYFSKRDGGLLALEQMWREHFINVMKPNYLPDLWSVKHNEERLWIKWSEGRLSENDLKVIGARWS